MINDNKAPVKRESKVHEIKDALFMQCKKSTDAVATISDIASMIDWCNRNDFYTIEVIIRVLFNVDKQRGKHYKTGEIVTGFPVVPVKNS